MAKASTDIDHVDLLARMIALSKSFQSETEKYGVTDATTRIHQVLADEPDALPRPFAVIEFGDFSSTRIAGGDRNVFATEAFLRWMLASEMSWPDDPRKSMKEFRWWAERVHRDVLALAGYDSYLNITGIEQEMAPVMSEPRSGDVVPFIWTSWRVMYGTF